MIYGIFVPAGVLAWKISYVTARISGYFGVFWCVLGYSILGFLLLYSGFCDHELFREHVNEFVNDRTGKVLITIVYENRPWVTNPAEFPFV